ncbi:hypothetical protein BXZ70DRAFT_913419 [Cristinia sonorae]|uniref:Uncharacterized protein n=1 Tax=Cristinia sonorae TaxID=1940300 RepID=A0A8K0XV13_9AGAR|nr:hypothetical protein BXZ70DRAFT_913419 [Cristinia sonorae]
MSNNTSIRSPPSSWSSYSPDGRPLSHSTPSRPGSSREHPRGPRPRHPSSSSSLHSSKHSFTTPDNSNPTARPTIPRLSSLFTLREESPSPRPPPSKALGSIPNGSTRRDPPATNQPVDIAYVETDVSLETTKLRQDEAAKPMPGPADTVGNDTLAPAPSSRAPQVREYLDYSQHLSHSPPQLATSPFSPQTPALPATPPNRSSLYIRQSATYNAPLFPCGSNSSWRHSTVSTISFNPTHRRNASSSSTTSSSLSSYSPGATLSPARLPIGKRMGIEATKEKATAVVPPAGSIGLGRGRIHPLPVTGESLEERDTRLSSHTWQRPELSINTRKILRTPSPISHLRRPSRFSTISNLPRGQQQSAGLGLGELNLFEAASSMPHHDESTSPHSPSLIPPSPSAMSPSDSELGPLSAALSAGALSPLEDTSLSAPERRARRRQGVDFHSHAQLVELFQLSDVEVEADYVFDEDPRVGTDDSSDHNCADGVEEEETDIFEQDTVGQDFNLDRPVDPSPTLTSVLLLVSGNLPAEDKDDLEEDFSWEAEDPDVDHSDTDQSAHLGGKNENGSPQMDELLLGLEEQRRPSPHPFPSPIIGLTVLPRPKSSSGSVLDSLLSRESFAESYEFPDEEPIPHSPADKQLLRLNLEFMSSNMDFDDGTEPRSAFSDSDSDCGSYDNHSFRGGPSGSTRNSGSGTGSSAFSKKFRAIKASMSMSNLKRTRAGSITHEPLPHSAPPVLRSLRSPSTSSVSVYSHDRPVPSLLSSPMTTQSSLQPASPTSRTTSVSHSHSSSAGSSSGYQTSSRTSFSHDRAPSAPPKLPLPPIPTCNSMPSPLPNPYNNKDVLQFIYSHPANALNLEFDPYTMVSTNPDTVEVDGSRYRVTVMDPDTSMAKLEMSMERLRAHRPPSGAAHGPRRTQVIPMFNQQGKRAIANAQRNQIKEKMSSTIGVDNSEEAMKVVVPRDTSLSPPKRVSPLPSPPLHSTSWQLPPGCSSPSSPAARVVDEKKTLSLGQVGPVPEGGTKPSLTLLPLFDFERFPRSPVSPISPRQARLTKQLRRTSSLVALSDLRQALRLSVTSASSTRSSESDETTPPTSSRSEEVLPLPVPPSLKLKPSADLNALPAIPAFAPSLKPKPSTATNTNPNRRTHWQIPPPAPQASSSPNKKITPFILRRVRTECIPDRTSHLPGALAPPPPPPASAPAPSAGETGGAGRARRPSFVPQIRIRSLSGAAGAEGQDGKTSLTRRLLGRVGVSQAHSEKRMKSSSVLVTRIDME